MSLVHSFWIAQVAGSVFIALEGIESTTIQSKQANKENPTTSDKQKIPGNSDALLSCHGVKTKTLPVTAKCMLR